MTEKKLKFHFQRFEFKYQMPRDLVDALVPEFLKYMDVDPYAAMQSDGAYKVSSLYFDSAGYDCYYQKLAGLRTRKKLRLRFYGDLKGPETPVFLEIKKKYDTVVVKDRIVMPYDQCYGLLREGRTGEPSGHQSQAGESDFLWVLLRNGMTPQNMVVYRRRPFISKVDADFRVTIDSQLRTYMASWLDEKHAELVVAPDTAVLEVKFNNVLPFWFHQIIQRYGLAQQPFSKYCNSLEVCIPSLSVRNAVETYHPELLYN